MGKSVDAVEPSAKDKDNVMLQIQECVAAGYEDREIVGGVTWATPDPSLRDFLVAQVMGGFTVEGLKEVLGTHQCLITPLVYTSKCCGGLIEKEILSNDLSKIS